MMVARVLLTLLFAAACGYTLLGYPAKYGALSGRSRLFRTVGVFLFDLLLGLVLMATFIDFGYATTKTMANFRSLMYLLACLFLSLALVCIAVMDWLESLVAYRRAQRDLLERMTRKETADREENAEDSAEGKTG